MKNATVEAMVRAQYNLNDSYDVLVEHLASTGNMYEFRVRWNSVEIEELYHIRIELPQLPQPDITYWQ